jgi:hypothetical protein
MQMHPSRAILASLTAPRPLCGATYAKEPTDEAHATSTRQLRGLVGGSGEDRLGPSDGSQGSYPNAKTWRVVTSFVQVDPADVILTLRSMVCVPAEKGAGVNPLPPMIVNAETVE